MAGEGEFHKCACHSCGVHLEFVGEMVGVSIACPHCGEATELRCELAGGPTDRTTEDSGALTLGALLGAFQGRMRRPGTSFFYTFGLLLVTIAVALLPVAYLALIGATGYGVYWWATEFAFLLKGTSFGIYFYLARLLLYIALFFAGLTVLFFMVKPFLARRVSHAQPLALNPQSEPLLFAFIEEICRTVGAPMPSRIDVNCQLNAAASFRRGFKSIFGNDLVLTLGLPLVAGMNVTQLAGVIAHEFGHFTQSVGMRLRYIVGRVIGWFGRVIYERDQWDVMLEEASMDTDQDWRVTLIVAVTRFGVWLSRSLLKVLMYIGVGVSSYISRQMEYDADGYEIEFIGSQTFEDTSLRLAVLSVVSDEAYRHLQTSWKRRQVLPESVPAFLREVDARLPETARTAVADRAGLAQCGMFSTHPATGDRIRLARRAARPGIFAMDVPATELFENFEVISRQVTLLHYTDDLGLPLPRITFRPAETFFENAQPVG